MQGRFGSVGEQDRYLAESILTSLEAAKRVNLPVGRLVLEVVEGEIIDDASHFTELISGIVVSG
jgi:EAL domain-containing protein (putative c-di-GMP-specific phosphodiesterase class I)